MIKSWVLLYSTVPNTKIMKKFNVEDSLIDQKLLEKFPDWWKNINSEDYYLVMTDDCDSLFACARLHTLFGLEVGGFFSFDSGLYLNDIVTDLGGKTPIYVDLSISQNQLCFDNHRTFISNHNSVNPNIIHREYKDKYNFSTLALIMALYGGIDKMSEKLKEVIIAIDGGFIGYYKNGGRYKDVNLYWLNKLGLTDYLLPILEKRNMEYFQDFQAEHGLKDKIFINDDGYLETPTYKVPNYHYSLECPVKQIYATKPEAISMYNRNNKNILVSAELYKNKYVLNIAV